MLIVRLENKSGQELFVVKLECHNNVSVAVCRRDSFTTRQFKVEDLICDTSQFFLRNNAFIFFQKSDTFPSESVGTVNSWFENARVRCIRLSIFLIGLTKLIDIGTFFKRWVCLELLDGK